MQSLAFSSSCELGGEANAAVSILLLLRTDSSVLAQLYQLARLNGDFCGLLAGKCESNQWGAMTKRL